MAKNFTKEELSNWQEVLTSGNKNKIAEMLSDPHCRDFATGVMLAYIDPLMKVIDDDYSRTETEASDETDMSVPVFGKFSLDKSGQITSLTCLCCRETPTSPCECC